MKPENEEEFCIWILEAVIKEGPDIEALHSTVDTIVLEALRHLGWDKLADEAKHATEKAWYA